MTETPGLARSSQSWIALRIALADEEDDRGGVGRGIVRQALLPVGRDLAGLGGDRVDVGGERERHDIRREPVDHRAGLRARSAMRLLDRDRLAGVLLPFLDEGRVDRAVKLARRIIRDIEQHGSASAGDAPGAAKAASARASAAALLRSERL